MRVEDTLRLDARARSLNDGDVARVKLYHAPTDSVYTVEGTVFATSSVAQPRQLRIGANVVAASLTSNSPLTVLTTVRDISILHRVMPYYATQPHSRTPRNGDVASGRGGSLYYFDGREWLPIAGNSEYFVSPLSLKAFKDTHGASVILLSEPVD